MGRSDRPSPVVRSPWRLVLALGVGVALGVTAGSARAQDTTGAALYGAGLFSTGEWDFFVAFSPDQRRALFCRANADFSDYRIYETRRDDGGHWSAPASPRVAESWGNADPHISPDGRTLWFISHRPGQGERGTRKTYGIWSATLGPDGEWTQPHRLPAPVSVPDADDWSPSVASNGDLFFGSERRSGHGGIDIWVSHRTEKGYGAPENLGDSINTAGNEVEPWIAPDGSYLLFSGTMRSDSVGRYDLYISRRVHGVWQRAHPVAGGVNTPAAEFNQSVSPDGRWLYFSSTRPHAGSLGERFDVPRNEASVRGIGNGKGDIYRVPMAALGF